MRFAAVWLVAFSTTFFVTQSKAQATDPAVVLPPVIFATDGIPLVIRFDNVSNGMDSYTMEMDAPIGVIDELQWSFTASPTDEGLYPLSIRVRDPQNQHVAQANAILSVIPKASSNRDLRIMIIGDSLTAAGRYQRQLAIRLNAASINFTTMGTVQSGGFFFEGYGGNTYQRYLEGPWYFRSPFVYSDTGFDPQRYFNENFADQVPTLFIIFLGINDTFSASRSSVQQIETRLDEVMHRANLFIDGLRAAAPDADVAVFLIPAGADLQATYDAAYGAGIYTPAQWQVMRQKLTQRYIENFAHREHEGMYVIPTAMGIDRTADYPATDPIHLLNSGYDKIGDALFAWVNYYLRRDSYPRWALQFFDFAAVASGRSGHASNADCDLFNNHAEFIFDLDPARFSSGPFQLSSSGLSVRFRQGAGAQLQVSQNLTDWQRWEIQVPEPDADGLIHLQMPLSILNEATRGSQFFRIIYDSLDQGL